MLGWLQNANISTPCGHITGKCTNCMWKLHNCQFTTNLQCTIDSKTQQFILPQEHYNIFRNVQVPTTVLGESWSGYAPVAKVDTGVRTE
jgi:hypothetical protein